MSYLHFLPYITWSALLFGAVFMLNVWHRQHVSTLTREEQEEEDEELNYDTQLW